MAVEIVIYLFIYFLIYLLIYFLEKISWKNQEILIFHTMIVCVRVGFGIGIFCFGLDRKIPKIPKSRGSGFENLEKIPSTKFRKSWNPGDRDRDFLSSGYPGDFSISGIGIFSRWMGYPDKKSQLIEEILKIRQNWLIWAINRSKTWTWETLNFGLFSGLVCYLESSLFWSHLYLGINFLRNLFKGLKLSVIY